METHIEHLYKSYRRKQVLNDINLDIGTGMYGLLGENGAGKSTLLKILATVLGKSKGTITMNQIPIEHVTQIRNIIGYMPQEFSFYPSYTVLEIMAYFSALSCVSITKEDIEHILDELHLLQEKNKKVKSLSGGMKRRLGIAVAILSSPQLLLIDEPTAGLDPQERMNFKNMLVKLAKDRTVLFSTHIISDIEDTCEQLCILHHGTIIYKGEQSALVERMEGSVWEYTDSLETIEAFETQRTDIKIISRKTVHPGCTIRYISREATSGQNVSGSLPGELVKPRLEDAYIKLISAGV